MDEGTVLSRDVMEGVQRGIGKSTLVHDQTRELPNYEGHPEAVPFIESGSYEGKPIVSVDHGKVEGDPYTLLHVKRGDETICVVFDEHGDELIDGDEDGLS